MGILWYYSFIENFRGESLSTSIVYFQNIYYMNSTGKWINQFSIQYMVHPTWNVNKVFKYQVENFLKEIFHSINMSGIRKILKKENTYVIALVMFYENRTTNAIKVLRVLSCVIYTIVEN